MDNEETFIVCYEMCNILEDTSNINNIYCNVYDFVFNQRFGDRIDYRFHLSKLSDLLGSLRFNILKLNQYKDEIIKTRELSALYQTLTRYQICLEDSLVLLKKILFSMHEKSNGGRGCSYISYIFSVRKLTRYETKRSIIGDELQNLAVPFIYAVKHCDFEE